MRALSTGELLAIRDNKNAWRISQADLEAWSGQRPVTDQTPRSPALDQPAVTLSDTPETLEKLAVAEARLADAIADRDHWRDLALRLSEPRPAVGFFARLLGRQ